MLGLVTTKTARRETVDELVARIQEASRYVPLERLALSPQCGFATSILGNALTDRGRGGEARDDRRDGRGGLGMTVVLTGNDLTLDELVAGGAVELSSCRPAPWSGCRSARARRASVERGDPSTA